MPAVVPAHEDFRLITPTARHFPPLDGVGERNGGGGWTETREIHARRVKISRAAAPREEENPAFCWVFGRKDRLALPLLK